MKQAKSIKEKTSKIQRIDTLNLHNATRNIDVSEKTAVSYHAMTETVVLSSVGAKREGLTSVETKKRLERDGLNEIKEEKRKNYFLLFLSEFKDLMLIILIIAACMSATLAYLTNDSKELVDTFVIAAVILIDALIGFIQHIKADKSIRTLKKLAPAKAVVRRDGVSKQIDTSEIVVGDIIEITEGDVIPCDARILECNHLATDESSLTGETLGVNKTSALISSKSLPLADRKNMLYSSSFAIMGSGVAVCVATGEHAEVGKIATSIKAEKKKDTPLEKGLNTLGKVVSVFACIVALTVFLIGIFMGKVKPVDSFMTAIALAVAAIPEGLTCVVTVIMALGVTRMSKKKVIIRRLSAVETLGSVSMICSDKTGTMTENKMNVERIFTLGTDKNSPQILDIMRLCNTVKGVPGSYFGDPTEIALVEYIDSRRCNWQPTKIIDIVPFDTSRKRMSVIISRDGYTRTLTKGAVESVLDKCICANIDGRVVTLDSTMREQILMSARVFASDALRVLALAYADGFARSEDNLIFAGLVGMIDPPKVGVREAVAECKIAGIRTVMITGDHAETAYAIANRLGICTNRECLLTGLELDRMTQSEKRRRILTCKVFARVEPRQKREIVEIFRSAGFVVAMTGDGINDAPSIAASDIGIAMGIHGTEVTKNTAAMVLADDNFASIRKGVFEGRRIFDNIAKTITFFLSTNLAEVLTIILVTLFFGHAGLFISTQLLWINLITDSFPVFALGLEPASKDTMKRPPLKAEKMLFCKSRVASIVVFGIIQSIIAIGVFVLSQSEFGTVIATTMTFFTLTCTELLHTFNVRTENKSMFSRDFFSNPVLFCTVMLGLGANLSLAFVPALRDAFSLVPLDGMQWGIVAGFSFLIIPLVEIYKWMFRMVRRKQSKAKKKSFINI